MADSFIDKLRMNNIFGGAPIGMPDLNAGQINPDQISMLMNRLEPYRIRSDERHAGLIPQNGVTRQPQPQLGNIGRGVSGAPNNSLPGEPNTTKPMDVVYQPPLSETYQGLLANQKQREFELKQGLGYGKLGLEGEKIAQTGELGRAKLGQGDRGLDIKQGQLDINQFKAQHPNLQITKELGGNFRGYNPATGATIDLGPTGTVTDEQRQRLIGERVENSIRARGEAAGALEEQRQGGRLNLAAVQGDQTRQTNAAKPNKGLSPTQQKVQQITSAHQMLSENPQLEGMITFDPVSGIPRNMAQPGSPEFTEINNKLYGTGDINLPDENTGSDFRPGLPTKYQAPASSKSKNNDPLGIRR